MTDYVAQAVEHYKKLSGHEKLKAAITPYCPEGALHPDNDDIEGELSAEACSVLMKNLWAARLARPDILEPRLN